MATGSASFVVQDSLRRLCESSGIMPWCAEKIFWQLVEGEGDVFLNLPHLFEILTLLGIVGHPEPARTIKEQLFSLEKGVAKSKGYSKGFYNSLSFDKHPLEMAAHDLSIWEQKIRNQCMDNEYSSRARVYMNRMACRSYSFTTFTALNLMNIEWKVSDGTGELGRWAYGFEQMTMVDKCPFKVWDYDDDNREAAEDHKEKQKQKMKEKKNGTQKISNSHKCPLLLTASRFKIPLHPFLMDTKASYTIGVSGAQVKAIRLIQDSSNMMGIFKFEDLSCASIPCRNRDSNSSTMKFLVFWGHTGIKKFGIMDMLHSIVDGSNTAMTFDNQFREIHLPHWNTPQDSTNLAGPIRQTMSDHLFAEGGFGDLTESGVIPCAFQHNDVPPSIQTFDHVSIRIPADTSIRRRSLDNEIGEGIVRVSMPYTFVVYDDLVKMPIYLGRVVEPQDSNKADLKDGPTRACSIM